MYIHTSTEKGFRNENSSGSGGVGFKYRILIPKVIKGVVKSTDDRRS